MNMCRLFEIWGTPQIDLFPSAANYRLPMYCLLGFNQMAVHHDVLSLTWMGWVLYAFPPIPVLSKVLVKIRLEKVSFILIAPQWPRPLSFSDLLHLLFEIPSLLPVIHDLSPRLQEAGTPYHESLPMLHLVAWKLSGDPCRIEVFRIQLSMLCWLTTVPSALILRFPSGLRVCPNPKGSVGQ